jgi:CDP-diacylglycerol--glycerol-3-phosphate 3-phosphatidyltransferase
MILTFSNFLSVLRGSLAFVFLLDNPLYRCLAIFLAMLTDCLDGYLARRWNRTSRLGVILDPLMDKFFVFFIVSVFMREQRLQTWQALAFISRDFAVILFGAYLKLKGSWTNFKFRSIYAGKVTTAIQFFVLLALTLQLYVTPYLFFCFIALGFVALIELCLIERQIPKRI